MVPPRGRASQTWIFLTVAVLGLTAIAYSPALRGPQIYDDAQSIQDNPTITRLWPLSIPLHPPAGSVVAGRPLVNLSLAFNYWLNSTLGIDQSPDPGGPDKTISYHVVNLVFHLACGLLLLAIVRRTLASGRLGDRWRDHAEMMALLVAACWLVHPIQTEAVDYLIQRTELIVSFCYLLTLYCSVRAWDATTARVRSWWLVGSVVVCALGMGAKEVMFSAPIIVVLYDRAFRTSSWRDLLSPATARRWYYGALAASWLLLIAILQGRPRGVTVGAAGWLSPLEYLHTQGWAILHYLRLVFLPTTLSIDYSYQAIAHWRGIPGLLVLTAFAVLTIVAWTRANRWGWFGFLGAWFFLILAPSSSVVPIVTELVAERRMYLALAAVIVLTIVAIEAAWQRWIGAPPQRARTIAAVAATTIVALLLALTFQRSALYASPEKLWRDAVSKVPDDPRAWVNLGAVLAAQMPPQRAAADTMFREALRRDSLYPDAILNVAIDELDTGRLADAEPRFRRFLAFDSTNAMALGGLAQLMLRRGDTVAAVPLLERYVVRNPTVGALMLLSSIYLARGKDRASADAVRQAVALDPSNPDLTLRLAGMLVEQGRPAEAKPYLETLVQLQPNSAVILALMSLDAAALGDAATSAASASTALRFAGNNETVYFYLGRAMAAAHNNVLAEEYLSRAVTLEPRDADALTELGQVEAMLGKTAAAADCFRRALRLAPQDRAAQQGLARLH
jgi:protein O-mannosyl-transferase